jgi:hypothetical protein
MVVGCHCCWGRICGSTPVGFPCGVRGVKITNRNYVWSHILSSTVGRVPRFSHGAPPVSCQALSLLLCQTSLSFIISRYLLLGISRFLSVVLFLFYIHAADGVNFNFALKFSAAYLFTRAFFFMNPRTLWPCLVIGFVAPRITVAVMFCIITFVFIW